MKYLFLLISILISSQGISQTISESTIHGIYLECLNDFLLKPIELHKKDKDEIMVTNSENMSSPITIANKKVIWLYGDIEFNQPLKGNNKRHNGRSLITLSYKLIENDSIEVQIHQWFLTNLQSEEYMVNPIPKTNKEYAKKKNVYYFSLHDNQWILKY